MERKKQNNTIEMNSNNFSNINKKIFNNMKYKKNALEQSYNKENAKVNNKVKNNKLNNLTIKNNKSVNYRSNNEHSSKNSNKYYNNGFYNNKLEKFNKNTMNKDYNSNKYVIDYDESIKKARNSSAPSLKQKENENQNIIKSNKYHNSSKIKKDNANLFNNNKIIIHKKDKKAVDNISNNHQKYLKENQAIKNKIYDISQRINNIKQNYNFKNNKRNFQNNLNNYKYNKKSYVYDNYKNNTNNKAKIKPKKSLKSTEENLEINLNIFKNILEKQEKILMMKKKLKGDKEKISSRNRRDIPVFTSYNKSFQNAQSSNKPKKNQHNKSYDNSLNNPIHNEINNKEIEINDEKEIEIDNEEKVLDINEDNFNSGISHEYNKDKKMNRTFQNNLYNNEKEEKKEVYSEDKKEKEKINTIEIDSINDKNIVNTNFNLYNKSKMNKQKEKNNKKDKKIRIINAPKYNDYYFTKSSNIYNFINNNNNLNRTIFEKNNKSKIKENNINKSKFNESYEIKKNNIIAAKRKKIKNDSFNNTAINNKIQKSKESKKKAINSSKIKKHNVKIKVQTPKIRENKSDNKLKTKKVEQIGCICRPGEISYGKQKINQDNYFNYNMNIDDLIYIGVCDGHGDYGHFISDYLVKHLPKNLSNSYNDFLQNLEEVKSPIPLEQIKTIFEYSFSKTDSDLNKLCDNLNNLSDKEEIPIQNIFNCEYSGSTCVSLLLPNKNSKEAYIANVGDSRAIIIKEEKLSKNDKWSFEQISRDHKPTEQDEYQRIIEADGEIEAIEDDDGNWTGPLRVWEKGSEGPGLAMTRSLGDKVGKKLGVCCTPEVTKYDIKEEDKVFVLASDGLWEYMSNQEVTDLVKNIYEDMKRKKEINGDKMAKILYDKAVERWREKDIGMDDITIICIILN